MTTAHAPGRNTPCPCGSGRKVKRCHPDGLRAIDPLRPAGAPGPPVPARTATTPDPEPATTTPELAPDPAPGHHDEALDAADAHLAAGRLDESVAIAGDVLAQDPGNGRAIGVLGVVAHRLGDRGTAADLLVASVTLRPRDPVARRRLAALLLDLGLRDQAVDHLRAAIDAAPQDGATYVDLAAIRLADGSPDEAGALLAQAIEADPDHRQARRRLTWLRIRQGRLEEARAAYTDFLAWEVAHPELVIPDPRGHRIHIGPVASVAAWCRAQGAAYAVTKPAAALEIVRPHYAPDRAGPPPAVVTRPERYVALLDDAIVVGRETLVIAGDGTILSDVATHPDAPRYDLVRGATRYADAQHALLDMTAEPIMTIDRAVALTSPGSPNWYHWLLEILTRLQTLETAGGEAAAWPLLLDDAAARIPQLKEALRMVVGPDRQLITIPLRRAARVRRLAVVAPGAWLPIDLRDGLMLEPHDCVVDPDAVAYLRDRLMPAALRDRQDKAVDGALGGRRLFLGRSREGRLTGADALGPVLAAHAIETVLPERMTVREQVALFADASLVVAESGAALTNLVFAPASARIVILGADRWDLTLFSQLAGHRGQEHRYVAGTPVAGSHKKLYQSRFTLDPAALDAALRDLDAGLTPGTHR